MNDSREFTAYLRKLLRALEHIQKALNENDIGMAKKLVEELRSDTKTDISYIP